MPLAGGVERGCLRTKEVSFDAYEKASDKDYQFYRIYWVLLADIKCNVIIIIIISTNVSINTDYIVCVVLL